MKDLIHVAYILYGLKKETDYPKNNAYNRNEIATRLWGTGNYSVDKTSVESLESEIKRQLIEEIYCNEAKHKQIVCKGQPLNFEIDSFQNKRHLIGKLYLIDGQLMIEINDLINKSNCKINL